MNNDNYNTYVTEFYNKYNGHVKLLLNEKITRLPILIDMIYQEIISNENGDMNVGDNHINNIISYLNGYVNHIFKYEHALGNSLELHNILKTPDYAQKIMKMMTKKSVLPDIRIHIFLIAYVTLFNYDLIEEYILKNGRIVYNCDDDMNNTGGIYYSYIIDKIAYFTFEDYKLNNRSIDYCKITGSTNKYININYCERHTIIRNDYRSKLNSVIRILLSDEQIKEINEFFNDTNMNNNTLYFLPKDIDEKTYYAVIDDSVLHSKYYIDHKIFTSHDRDKYLASHPLLYNRYGIHDEDEYIIVYPYDHDYYYITPDNIKLRTDFINKITRYSREVQTTLIDILEDKRIIITESMMVFIARYFDYESFMAAIILGGAITEKVLESACNINIGYASPIEKYKIIDVCSKQVKPTQIAFRNIIKSRYNYAFGLPNCPLYTIKLYSIFPSIRECFPQNISFFSRGKYKYQCSIYSILDYLVHDNNIPYNKLSKKYMIHKRWDMRNEYCYYYALNEAIFMLVKNGYKIKNDDLSFAYNMGFLLSSTFLNRLDMKKYDLSQQLCFRKDITKIYYNDISKIKSIYNGEDINNNSTNSLEKYDKDIIHDDNKIMDTEIIEKLDGNIIEYIKDDIKDILQIKDKYITYTNFREKMIEYLSKNGYITNDKINLVKPFEFNGKSYIKIIEINNWIISLLNIHNVHKTHDETDTVITSDDKKKNKIKTIFDINGDDNTDIDDMNKRRQRKPRNIYY